MFTLQELQQESRASPCLTSAGNMPVGWPRFVVTLSKSKNSHKSNTSISFGVRINFGKKEIWQIQGVKNRDPLYLCQV